MGSVYLRRDSGFWWVAFVDASGRRKLLSSKSADRAFAVRLLESIEKEIAAQKAAGFATERPVTVGEYAAKWIAERRRKHVASVDSEEDRLAHVPRWLASMALSVVRRADGIKLVDYLKTDARTRGRGAPVALAPRTVRHVYFVLRQMFDDAVIDGLVLANPMTLKAKRGELPRKRDKVAGWRGTAVYTRAELEQLLSDARIPEYRRVLFALQALGGLRINEATPRLWEDYDDATEPLGRLRVLTGFDPKRKVVKGTKTDVVREVPVHPTLAKVLAAWRLGGWERYQGRAPRPGDRIVPSPDGGTLNSNSTLLRLHEDQATLGLRKRRQHDARRTFISLARGGGASKDLLRWVTHGPEGDVVDDYTTPPWHSLCEQVALLKVSLLEGAVLTLNPQRRSGAATATGGTGND